MPDTELQNVTSTSLVQAAPEVGEMFYTIAAFEAAQRMAVALAKSTMLPSTYQDNPANCMVLISVAHAFRHMGVTPFMVAQQLVPVNGKFGWQGQFVAAVVNASNRFDGDLQYKFEGEGDKYGCVAWTKRKDGAVIEGTKITWEMVKAEGWSGKTGSKWKTMPEQMFRYRAASFFGKAYTPDLLQGFQTADELDDMKDVTPRMDKGAEMTEMLNLELHVEQKGFTPPTAPANPQPAMFDDSHEKWADPRKVTVKLGDVGKVRKDSVVDDVDAPF